MARCRCRSGKTYRRCCQPYHQGKGAPTPEALMRSRYCAYAKGLVDYIIATTDPNGPQWKDDAATWRAEIEEFSRSTRFEGLSIEDAGADGEQGWVAFRASLSRAGQDASFGERSRFTREGGRWQYHSGQPLG